MSAGEKKAADTKKRIFEAALTIFTDKGYVGTTMDDVIAAAGVSKGSIYWHFDSKQELFSELFEYFFEGIRESYAAALAGEEGEGGDAAPMERMRLMIRETLAKACSQIEVLKAFMEFFNIGMKDPEFRSKFTRFYVERTSTRAADIEEGIRRGYFAAGDPYKNALAVLALLDGFFLRCLLEPELQTEEYLQAIEGFIERALGYGNRQENKR